MKRNIITVIILLLVVGILSYFALQSRVIQKPAAPTVVTFSPTPAPTVAPDTTLSFSPQSMTIPASASGQFDILVNAGTNKLTAVQLEIAYDPTIMQNVTLTPGTFFSSKNVLLNKVDTANGRISFAIGITTNEEPVIGTGHVATLTFVRTDVPTASSSVSLLPKSLATQLGVKTSVLKSTKNAVLLFPGQTTPIIVTPML